jgi:ribulose-phosphate 3-epimerase
VSEHRPVGISPSILSADLGRLAEQVAEAAAAGSDRIQVDVMDGRFVPNLSFGPRIVEAVRRAAPQLPIEAHLMVERPERFLEAFAGAGANYLIIHVEATNSLYRAVNMIRELGCQPGLALNPATPVQWLQELVRDVAMVLVMTVEPGFGGQKFIEHSPGKVQRVSELVPYVDVEVDGGIDAQTAPSVTRAGANLLVAGSSVFRHPEGVAAGIRALREASDDNRA